MVSSFFYLAYLLWAQEVADGFKIFDGSCVLKNEFTALLLQSGRLQDPCIRLTPLLQGTKSENACNPSFPEPDFREEGDTSFPLPSKKRAPPLAEVVFI